MIKWNSAKNIPLPRNKLILVYGYYPNEQYYFLESIIIEQMETANKKIIDIIDKKCSCVYADYYCDIENITHWSEINLPMEEK